MQISMYSTLPPPTSDQGCPGIRNPARESGTGITSGSPERRTVLPPHPQPKSQNPVLSGIPKQSEFLPHYG